MLAQPRDVGEQPLVRGLAEREVEEYVVVGDVEAFGELLDVVRDQRGLAGRSERETDVARGEHLARESAQRGTDLAAEHGTAGLADHPDEGTGHRLGLLGHRVAHGTDDVLGHRLDQDPPHVGGLLDPLGAAPRGRRGDPGGEHGDVVEPVVGQPDRVGDLGLVVAVGARVGLLGGGLAGDVRGEGPVHRAVVRRHHRLHLAHQRRQVGHAALAGLSPRPGSPPDPPSALKICSKGVPLNGLSSGPSGLLLMGPNYRPLPNPRPGWAPRRRSLAA